ncbi:MAG: hypothetical protein OXU61_12170 [Gammaproteobacteria bacterium]|nr:hypothetical protein [Gammaproteobacteria bacterium]
MVSLFGLLPRRAPGRLREAVGGCRRSVPALSSAASRRLAKRGGWR